MLLDAKVNMLTSQTKHYSSNEYHLNERTKGNIYGKFEYPNGFSHLYLTSATETDDEKVNKEKEEKAVKPKKSKMAEKKTEKKAVKNKESTEQLVMKDEVGMKKSEDDKDKKKKKKKKKKDKSELNEKTDKIEKTPELEKAEKAEKSDKPKKKKSKKESSKKENIPSTKSELNKEKKVPVKQPENQFKSEETVVIPRDDGPGLDLSIFEPRGKRKCVIELEERKESKKAWWEGEDEIEKDSDEKVKEEDEDDSFSDDTEAPKKKKRKRTSKVKKPPEPPKQVILPPNRAYVFSTALADRAAYAVLQGKFNSITAFHRAQSWATPYLQANIHCIPFQPEPKEPKPPKQEQSRSSTPEGFATSGQENVQSDSEHSEPAEESTAPSSPKQEVLKDQIRERAPGERGIVLNDWQRYQMIHLARQAGHPLRMEEFHKYLYRGGMPPGMPPRNPYMPRMPSYGPPPLRGLIRSPETDSSSNEKEKHQKSDEEEEDQGDSGVADEKENDVSDDDAEEEGSEELEEEAMEEEVVEEDPMEEEQSKEPETENVSQPVASQSQENEENGPLSSVDSLSSDRFVEEPLPSPRPSSKLNEPSRSSPDISTPASPPRASSPDVHPPSSPDAHQPFTNNDAVLTTTVSTSPHRESPRAVYSPVTEQQHVPVSAPLSISTGEAPNNSSASQLSPFAGYRGRPATYPADIVNVKSQPSQNNPLIIDLEDDKPDRKETSPMAAFVDLSEAQKNITRPNSLDLKSTNTSELRDYVSRYSMPSQPNHVNPSSNSCTGGVLRAPESSALNRHFDGSPAVASHAINSVPSKVTPASPIMPHCIVSSTVSTNAVASPVVSNNSHDSPRPLSHPNNSSNPYSRPERSPAPLQHPPRQAVTAAMKPTSPSYMSNSVISPAITRMVTSPTLSASSPASQVSPKGQPPSPAAPYNPHPKGTPRGVPHLGSYTAQDMARLFQGKTLTHHSVGHSQESARKLQGLAYPFQEKGHASHELQRGLHGLLPGHHEASRTAQEIVHSLQGSTRQGHAHGLARTPQEITRQFPGHSHALHGSSRALHDSLHARAMHDSAHSRQLHESSVGRGIHENPLARTAHDAIHARGLHDTSHARLSRALHEASHGRTLHDIAHAPSHAGLSHSYQQHLRSLQGNHSSHSPSSMMAAYRQNRDFTSPSSMKTYSNSPTVQQQTLSEPPRKSFSVESLTASEANDRSKYPFYNGQPPSGSSSRPGHSPSAHAQHMYGHMSSLARGATPEFLNLPPHMQQMYAARTGMNPFLNYAHYKGR